MKTLTRIVGFLCLWICADGLLSPGGFNYEVQALIAIKDSLGDPHGILDDWDANAVDPCSWNMVTCTDGVVVNLGIPSQNLHGKLKIIVFPDYHRLSVSKARSAQTTS